MTLLSVNDLIVEFRQSGFRARSFRAVDSVSLEIREGEAVGLVGESGSGKSTVGRSILGLNRPNGGSIVYDNSDITHVSRRRRRVLSSEIQSVFQSPYTSLDPRMTVGQSVLEAAPAERAGDLEFARTWLDRVGLRADTANVRPALLSGGQRQRVAIARALAAGPRLVVCDEPISALDLSTQAQVLNLLAELRDSLSVSYLFISHDLGAVRYLSDVVIVLYRGMVMERGPSDAVCGAPAHPYTQALWSAAPVRDPKKQILRRKERQIANQRISPEARVRRSDGCPFAPRCVSAMDVCWTQKPKMRPAGETEAACHLYPAQPGQASPERV